LVRSFSKPRNAIATHPLHGPNGLVFTPDDKAQIFADQLETEFNVSPEPYNEDTIQLVNN